MSVINHKPPATSYEPPATSYELQATSHQLRTTSYKPPIQFKATYKTKIEYLKRGGFDVGVDVNKSAMLGFKILGSAKDNVNKVAQIVDVPL